MSSITGLGLRNKVGLGKSSDSSSSKPKQQGSSITGLGLRNKATGLAGRARGSGSGSDPDAGGRTAAPLSTLKDPASFAPPPKNANFYGTEGAEREPEPVPQKGPLTPAEYRAREEKRIKREKEEEALAREQRRYEREEKERLRIEQQGGPISYSTDTTGLSTNQFAPPVARRTAPDGTIAIRAPSMPKAKPALPPRLPDRPSNNSSPITPTYGGRPQLPTRVASSSSSTAPSTPSTASSNPQLSELQSRFARMATSSPASSPDTDAPPKATTWAEKQALLRASSAVQDHAAAAGVNSQSIASAPKNIPGRYGEQVATAWKSDTSLPAKKAPPPPPPKKKAGLSGLSVKTEDAPPPIPLASKPTLHKY
ncbi:hypothetical protein BP6252_13899 [Coleophoma cylindrospora]|uniref:Uncharacterized protein n=1 Tax=Coleophoma cylindrospora TaxID=1849047 RepID=A0A3D8Q5S4_9HELO|nr:hypothetical protein BP6252_13899 [Coleophoma cylindrospora]